MRIPFLGLGVAALLLAGCSETDGRRQGYARPPAGLGEVHASPAGAAPPATAAPGDGERREAAKGLLQLLDKHIATGALDYHFNPSGEGVCLATAGLAFVGSGSTLARGPYKTALTRILARIREIMDQNDFPLQPVWGCAQSAVFLAELHRTAPAEMKEPVRALLAKYVGKLVAAQTPRGSWCHTFEDVKNQLGYDDLVAASVMVMQGLGMARREGVEVPAPVIEHGLKYIADSSDASSGHIGYSPRSGQLGIFGPGRAGGGLLALLACGQERSPLSRAAAAYLIQCFASTTADPPQAGLNSGHASAQLGQMWAAWWAAESGCYDRFWAGQGAAIMSRRKPDGGFHPAPTDGKPADGAAETGDFANAMHALMLVAPEGLVFAGQARDGVPRPEAALGDAQDLIAGWGEGAPECLTRLAALQALAKPPSTAEVAKQLGLVVKELARIPGERSGAAILALLGARIEAKAAFDEKARRISVDLAAPPLRLPGLAKAKLQIEPVPELMSVIPSERFLSFSASAPLKLALAIPTKPGQQPGEALDLELAWDLAGMAHVQALRVPIQASAH